MKTKAFALFLTLVMMIGSMPAIVFAEEPEEPFEGVECTGDCTNEEHVAAIGNVHYDSIQAAVDAAEDGDTVVVICSHNLDCSSITNGALIYVDSDKNITIDLNGHTVIADYSIDGAAYSKATAVLRMADGSKAILKDSSLAKTGTLYAKTTSNNESADPTQVECLIYNGTTTDNSGGGNNFTLIIESGIYKMEYCSKDGGSLLYAQQGNRSTWIKGGTFLVGNIGGGSNNSPWIFNIRYADANRFVVTGGTFSADVNHQHYEYEVEVPNEYALRKNADDTWTVVPAVAYIDEYHTKYGSTKYIREVGYATLEETVQAANVFIDKDTPSVDYEKITLLTNCTVKTTLELEKNFVIDFNSYSIFWEGNKASPVVHFSQPGTLSEFSPARKGTTFEGWYTDSTYQTQFEWSADEIPAGTSLYAKWTPKTYNISYSVNEGTMEGSNPATYTVESDDITLINPTKTGYTFAGWTGTDLNSPTETVTIPKGSFGNRTYTANWTANQYDVTFFTDSGTINSNMIDNYTYGVGATLPTDVIKSGYRFGGWYDNVECTGDPVTAIGITEVGNKEFYAKWTPVAKKDPTYTPVIDNGIGGDITVSDKSPEQGDQVTITANPDKGYEVNEIIVTDSKGNPVEVIKNDDGTYSYIQPAGKVTITANYVCDGGEGCLCKGYTDLDPDQWYHEAVDYVVENGIMNGVGEDEFDPNGELTRAMMWTMLARLDGVDTTGDSVWYASALEWAKDKGITDGTGANKDITREQMVTMLYRYAQYKGHDVSVGEDTNILSFEDALEISEWAMPAMQWACGAGVIEGDGSKLDPLGLAARAEMAQIFFNYFGK